GPVVPPREASDPRRGHEREVGTVDVARPQEIAREPDGEVAARGDLDESLDAAHHRILLGVPVDRDRPPVHDGVGLRHQVDEVPDPVTIENELPVEQRTAGPEYDLGPDSRLGSKRWRAVLDR